MATYPTPRIITVAVIAIALGAPPQPSTTGAELAAPTFSTAKTSPAPAVELPAPVFAAEQDEGAYGWAQDLFAAAGFREPTAVVEFSTDADACGGARGRAWLDEIGAPRIAICATHTNPEVQETWRQRTLLHELAHVWVDENVNAETLESFTELRQLETWSSRDVNWEERATEHAAEILVWGMQDGDYRVDFRLDNTDCADLSAGYELLTGIGISCEGESA